MKTEIWFAIITSLAMAHSLADPPKNAGYELVWSDEFNGAELDSSKWGFAYLGPGGAAGNFMKTENNVKLDGKGNLLLLLKMNGGVLEIGEVRSAGKFEQSYGYFEARMKVPKADGLNSGFWLQRQTPPKNPDGTNGVRAEIDIAEIYSKHKGEAHHTVHHDDTSGAKQKPITAKTRVLNPERSFHIYAVEWTPEKYVFYVDDKKTAEFSSGLSPGPNHICLSCYGNKVATGQVVPRQLPDQMVVDFVRVYKKKQANGAGAR